MQTARIGAGAVGSGSAVGPGSVVAFGTCPAGGDALSGSGAARDGEVASGIVTAGTGDCTGV